MEQSADSPPHTPPDFHPQRLAAVRILALETASTSAAVAALQADQVLAGAVTGPGERSAKSLAPLVERLLQQVGWQPAEVELVAVTQGPGSFTGLRIGVTMAKMFAWGAGCELLGVSTLAVLAAQAAESAAAQSAGRIVAVMDAQRQEFYTANFSPAGEPGEGANDATRICRLPDWLRERQPTDLVTGSGLKLLADQLPPEVTATEPSLWRPTAEMTGRLAWQDYQAGKRQDLWKFLPEYYRRSAAEEKRDGQS